MTSPPRAPAPHSGTAAPSAPEHGPARAVIRVTDHGADRRGRADSAPAVRSALEAARDIGGPVTIEFPCGTYHLYPEAAAQRELYVSNTIGTDPDGALKTVAVLIEEMHDVIVEGCGSLLVLHGRQTQFAVLRSRDVTIRDLRIDWSSPSTLDLTVIASGTDGEHGWREVRLPAGVDVEDGDPLPTFTGERSVDGEPYWSIDPSMFDQWQQQVRDLATGTTLRGPWLWRGVIRAERIDDTALRLVSDTPSDPGGVGTVHEFRRTYRDTPAVLIFESARVRLESLDMHYLHGFGIVGQISEDIALDRLRIAAAPGTWRQSAGFADFVQMSGVGGTVQITRCLFDNPHDDPINIHGTYLQITAIDPRTRILTVRYMQVDAAGFPAFRPGDEVRFVSRSTMLTHPGTGARVAEIIEGPSGYDRNHDLRSIRLRLDRDVPDVLEVDRDVIENVTLTPRVLVAGCRFSSVPTRGILLTTSRASVIEDNRFDRMGMSTIYISDDANSWYESGHVEDLAIRRNVIDRPAAAFPVIWCEPIASRSEAGRCVHHGIRIEDNEISLPPGTSALTALSVADLRVSGLTIRSSGVVTPETPGNSPVMVLEGCSQVTITDSAVDPDLDMRPHLRDTDASSVVVTGTSVLPGPTSPAAPALLIWNDIAFEAEPSPGCRLTVTPAAVTEVTCSTPSGLEGRPEVRHDHALLTPDREGVYRIVLAPGPNVVEAVSRDERGARVVQRWAIISDRPPLPHARPAAAR